MRASAKPNIAAVGPQKPPLEAVRAIPGGRVARYAFEAYLETGRERRVALCPSGRDVEEDLAFLRAARRRLLWPAPPRAIADAIAGLRTEGQPPAPPSRARRGGATEALLLEGAVTLERARAALASPVRLWVVEHVARVRLDAGELALLARHGVRWAALEPVELAGLVASPRLARARARWRPLLGARVPLWVAGRARD